MWGPLYGPAVENVFEDLNERPRFRVVGSSRLPYGGDKKFYKRRGVRMGLLLHQVVGIQGLVGRSTRDSYIIG